MVVSSVIGALGVLAWLTAARAVKTGKRWARHVATVMFVLGASAGLAELLTKDTSGATGLPPEPGRAGIIPCQAGGFAVTPLWRRRRPT
ncbi:hypothetical protein JK364_46185 [Streptomyces sp. 110]|uniref:Integral membrane protein n=1 Tax=Streptomyces endocoffeicus TaxID=2898945 RepID=A0ABS1Q4Q1_9ACTN|nr:hypothetical protein [Streptomyces endocoffeicus]